MKHKNLSFIGKSLLLTVLATITINVSNLFSQANQGINVNNGNQPFWKLGGNNNTDENSFIGTTNEQDFVFKTNNEERFRVTTDNYTIFNDSVRIKGPLYIGDSSMVFEDNVGWFPFTDRISSNNIMAASVDSDGLIIAAGIGEAIIKVCAGGISKEITVNVAF